MIEKSQLLSAYDASLRSEAEMSGALRVDRLGPLWLGLLEGGQGFVSYAGLGGTDRGQRVALIRDAVAHFEALGATEMEWKTRSHDEAPGLEEALVAAGFAAEESESVMLGPVDGLVGKLVPPGVRIAEARTEAELAEALRVQDVIFEAHHARRLLPEILRRWAEGDTVRVFAAVVGGPDVGAAGARVVAVGRIDPIPGTDIAGLWGGGTLPEFRRRGIYAALTSARVAAVARENGVRLVHSDSTEDSRPVLERAGLSKVTETTPYVRRLGRAARRP